MDMMIASPDTPTGEAYGELQFAYDEYNAKLFDGSLPPCLITMHNSGRRTFGYFYSRRFIRLAEGSTRTDEISMNPRHFQTRTAQQVLSTLVHEMCHLWQFHFGHPSRSAYHNKEWAAKMKSIGLQPSNTSAPGGKQTGQRMSHYIVNDGPFDRVTTALLAMGFTMTWGQRPEPDKEPGMPRDLKYVCPECGLKAKAKPGARFECMDCVRQMVTIPRVWVAA